MKYDLKLTKAHIQQLFEYLEHRDQGEDGGWYYPPKAAFEKRHEELRDFRWGALLHPIKPTK